MNRNFLSFEYQIVEKEFLISENSKTTKTALIKFLYENDETVQYELGFVSGSEFLKLLEENIPIQINKCLIEKFEIPIKKTQHIEITESLILNSEKINVKTKFSSTVNFNKSVFYCSEISFMGSEFKENATFTDTLFKAEKIEFSNCIFYNGLNFKNSVFSESQKIFEYINVLKGEINFTNVNFGAGSTSFQDSKFSDDRKIFLMANFGNGLVDFTRVNFGKNDCFFERANFGDGNVSFRSSVFGDGTIDFRRSEFGDGEKNFQHVQFGNGSIKFINSIFKSGKLTFRLAEFGSGDIDFHFTKFGDTDVFFERTRFNSGTLDFKGVELNKGKFNFNYIDFGEGNFNFEGFEQKEGNFLLKNSVFGRGFINFENSLCKNVEFEIENVDFGQGSISFQNSEFDKILLKGTQINSYFDLRVKYCKVIDLSNTVINDVLDLNPTETGLNTQTLYLNGIRLLGRIYLDWDRSNVIKLIHNQDISSYQKAEQFRILKENYRNMGWYEFEDFAYVEFKRMQSKAKMDEVKKEKFFKRAKIKIFHALELLIFDKMGHYATNPVRVLLSMLYVYLIFVVLYASFYFIGIGDVLYGIGDEHILSRLGKCFYFSAVTFLTIGYGDYYPVGLSRFLAGTEGFTGLFMMSYFTVAFVRKILR